MRWILVVALLAAIAILLARKQAILNHPCPSTLEEALLQDFSISTTLPGESHFQLLDKLWDLAQSHRIAFQANGQKLELYQAHHRLQQALALLDGMARNAAAPLILERLQQNHYKLFEAAVANAYDLYQQTDSLHYIDRAWFYAANSKTAIRKYGLPKAAATKKGRFALCQPQAVKKITALTLDADQTLIQYFLAESHLYAFVFSKYDSDVWKIPCDEKMLEAIKKVRQIIAEWPQSRTDDPQLVAYTQNAHWLYTQLLKPIEGRLKKRLIIIPDDLLEHLPFDALLYDSVNVDLQSFKEYPYLLRRHAIGYAPSLSFLCDLKGHKKKAPISQVLAFAPSYPENDSLAAKANAANKRIHETALLNNTHEIQRIAELVPSHTVSGSLATKERFLEKMGDYQVIHLAMHAGFDEQNSELSHLSFAQTGGSPAQNLLYAKELYEMNLNADLVVLSACETGMGEMKNGEGLVGLKNGFMYAGAKSQVASLWQVSDLETAQIMQLFYKGLVQKKSKDAAMQMAKLDYLQKAEPAFAHPFYWAAFTASGDVSALDFSNGTSPLWVTCSILGLVAQVLYMIARILGFIKHKEPRLKSAVG